MAKLKDIANEAGVSIRTVSRVLKDEPHIAPEKVKRVKEALEKLHYVPNLMARGLKSQKTKVIGIIANSLNLEVNTKKLSALQIQADKMGYRTLVGLTYGDKEKEQRFCEEFSQICDGLFFLGKPNKERLVFLKQENKPFIIVDSRGEDGVGIDRQSGIIEAFKTLKGQYQTFLLIAGDISANEDRYQGFHKGVFEIGEPSHGVIKLKSSEFKGGFEIVPEVMKYENALCLCFNDRVAAGLLKGLYESGLDVPGQYGIIGFDNDDFTAYTHKPISTISQNVDGLAEAALNSILNLINGGEEIAPPDIPTQYIRRATT